MSTSYKKFKVDSKKEYEETKELAKLIWEYKDRDLTPQEIEIVKNQSLDIVKLLILSGVFIIPFGSAVIFIFVKIGKKFGIKVLPSSFNKEEKKMFNNNYISNKGIIISIIIIFIFILLFFLI